jgi:CBS domain-containing protein
MGSQNIEDHADDSQICAFQEALLRDLRALEQMLASSLLERDAVRIGAEQEMFLLDGTLAPAPVAAQVLGRLDDPAFTTEMGKFSIEANLQPRQFEGGCLRDMEDELARLVQKASIAAQACGAEILLTGILPSVRLSDLTLENLTDKIRYHELNRSVMKLRGGAYHLLIKGVDELQLVYDNVMLEACCSSFQVHLQIDPHRFAMQYNAAQLAAAPALAVAVNSPVLLGKRLWSETRIALFQHAVDERSHSHIARSHPTRVTFGEGWVVESVLEIYREQIARFRTIMTGTGIEDPRETLANGGIPALSALRLHNSTIWRWNRPCYGITDGRPHLRLEFRAFPAGPTIIDEIANAAFLFGLVTALPEEHGNIAAKMPFDEAKDNFFAAARHGLKAQVTWLDGKHHPVNQLILEELLPLAIAGLTKARIDGRDIDRYLGVIRERVQTDHTGSKWITTALSFVPERVLPEQRDRQVVEAMLTRQKSGEPVHRWQHLSRDEEQSSSAHHQTAGDIMSTDLFTVSPDDPVTFAASLMDWRHIRNIPVEDESGRLVGLVSSRDILRLISKGGWEQPDGRPVPIRDIMSLDPVSIPPETLLSDLARKMIDDHVDCLPVTRQKQLVGLVTSHDLLVLLWSLLTQRGEETRAACSASNSAT